MNIPINQQAPVKAQQQLSIQATPEKVWEVLSSVNQWPQWQSAVSKASINGNLAAGTPFKWKAGAVALSSVIHTCIPFSQFGWTGKTFGAFAIHNWIIESIPTGCLVKVEESLEGFLPSLFRKKFSQTLSDGMNTNLAELKKACEVTA